MDGFLEHTVGSIDLWNRKTTFELSEVKLILFSIKNLFYKCKMGLCSLQGTISLSYVDEVPALTSTVKWLID